MRVFHFMNLPLTIDQLRSAGSGIDTSGGWMATLDHTTGEDTPVAAGSVVTRSIPPNVMAAGVPAKVNKGIGLPSGAR